jgi:hypothetical protein
MSVQDAQGGAGDDVPAQAFSKDRRERAVAVERHHVVDVFGMLPKYLKC